MNFWHSYDYCCEQIQYYEEQIAALTKMIYENKIKERYEYKDLKKKKKIRNRKFTIYLSRTNSKPNLSYIKELNVKLVLLREKQMDICRKYSDLYVTNFRNREQCFGKSSDHWPIGIQFFDHSPPSQLNTHWNLQNPNWEVYSELIEHDLSNNPIDFNCCDNQDEIDSIVKLFTDIIIEAAKKSIGLKTNLSSRKTNVPWWNKDCHEAILNYKKKLNRYKKTKSCQDHILLKNARARSRFITKNSKTLSWQEFTSSINQKTSPKIIWNKINSLKGNKFKTIPDILYYNQDKIVSTPNASESFAHFFQKNNSDENYDLDFISYRNANNKVPELSQTNANYNLCFDIMDGSHYIRSPEILSTSENTPKIKTPVGVFSVTNDVNDTSLLIKTTTSPKCRRNLFFMAEVDENVKNYNVYEDERFEKQKYQYLHYNIENNFFEDNECLTSQIIKDSDILNNEKCHKTKDAILYSGNSSTNVSVQEDTLDLLKDFELEMNTVDVFDSIELECVEYVAGYVASRYYEKYPQLISTKEEHTMCWTNLLSRGCLKIPSKILFEAMKLLETCFIKQHGNNVSKVPGVMKTKTDIMKKILSDYKLDIPEEVLSCMVRTRTFIRINNMNKSILYNNSLQKRNKKLKKFTS
ncbi:hypothetical protein ACI65C_004307 [Semiaphis heraclei]